MDKKNNDMIPKRIRRIYESLKDYDHVGNMRCKHIAIAVKNGKPVSPIGYNHFRTKVFGEIRGTMHAEMKVLHDLLKSFNNKVGHRSRINYKKWRVKQCFERCQYGLQHKQNST